VSKTDGGARLAFGPSWTDSRSDLQYVTSVSDPAATVSFGSGQSLDFREFAAPRSGKTFIYGRDRGTMTTVKDPATGLVASYTVDPDGTGPAQPFSLANPDFCFRSLRGSALFRWEYHPGSVWYMAWTHQRSDTQPYGDFDFTRDREGLLSTKPDNIFLVKASWWLARRSTTTGTRDK
jgi:hypothetical protein